MTKEKDLYIELIKYGKDKLYTGVKMSEAISHLESIGIKLDTDSKKALFREAFLAIFGSQLEQNNGGTNASESPRYLNVQSYFEFLDYEELQESRKSAEDAKKISGIAIFLAAVQILVGIFQYTQSTSNSKSNWAGLILFLIIISITILGYLIIKPTLKD